MEKFILNYYDQMNNPQWEIFYDEATARKCLENLKKRNRISTAFYSFISKVVD